MQRSLCLANLHLSRHESSALCPILQPTSQEGLAAAVFTTDGFENASSGSDLLQFLIESTVLSVLGGLIGIAISLIGSWIVATYFSMDATIALGSVFMAFGFSVGVGIFFGMLPAYTAAKLRPIEALRYE